jgi:hypothetical protein
VRRLDRRWERSGEYYFREFFSDGNMKTRE